MQRILVPIDMEKCPVEVFELINSFARQPEVAVILLHVRSLNIMAPDNRVYEELDQEARCHLERLARKHLRANICTRVQLRAGNPAKEILAEAAAQEADLIIMSAPPRSFWKRFFCRMVAPTVRNVAREAVCGVLVVVPETDFDSQHAWGRRFAPSGARWEYRRHDPDTASPGITAATDLSTPSEQEDRFAA